MSNDSDLDGWTTFMGYVPSCWQIPSLVRINWLASSSCSQAKLVGDRHRRPITLEEYAKRCINHQNLSTLQYSVIGQRNEWTENTSEYSQTHPRCATLCRTTREGEPSGSFKVFVISGRMISLTLNATSGTHFSIGIQPFRLEFSMGLISIQYELRVLEKMKPLWPYDSFDFIEASLARH